MFGQILATISLVTFNWTHSGGMDGFRLHYGTTSGAYVGFVEVTNYTETNGAYTANISIDLDVVKFVVFRSYNNWGESSDSNEVRIGPPTPPGTLTAAPAN